MLGKCVSLTPGIFKYVSSMNKMNRIAIYGREISAEAAAGLSLVMDFLRRKGVEIWGYEPLVRRLEGMEQGMGQWESRRFTSKQELEGVDMLFSVGGDGTFLDAVSFLGKSDVPVLGVNMGRLGFLADVPRGGVMGAFDVLREGRYEIEERTLVEVSVDGERNAELGCALNEVGIRRTDTSSLLTIRVSVEDRKLATYWADGLLVATPTGSTAYSMSCGGPIVWPTCDVLLLTPVCPHNLSMRPLVVPGDVTVRLEVESRTGEFVVGADSRSVRMSTGHDLCVTAAPFKVKVVKLPWHHFGDVLREKLMWGEDLRNGKEWE